VDQEGLGQDRYDEAIVDLFGDDVEVAGGELSGSVVHLNAHGA
jgi:hypothetical protein